MITELFHFCLYRFAAHLFGNLTRLTGYELSHLDIVFLPIKGHAQKRLSEHIAIGRVEIKIIIAVRHNRAVSLDVDGIQIMFFDRLFPLCAPLRCIFGK